MKPARAAVVGRPVKESLSPRIFRAFCRDSGRCVRYYALTLGPERLEAALRSARRHPWIGWNVTLPLKVAALPLVDVLDESARNIGAVNVLSFQQGRCFGYNTDAEGFLAPLARLGFLPAGKRAVILGAGGAARAACWGLRQAGVAELWVLNRTPGKAAALAANFSARGAALDAAPALDALVSADLVVNATSAGMDGKSCALPAGTRLKRGALAYDLVYRPRRTPFLEAAARAEARTLGGLGMLVAQAAATWRIWFKESPPERTLRGIESRIEMELP